VTLPSSRRYIDADVDATRLARFNRAKRGIDLLLLALAAPLLAVLLPAVAATVRLIDGSPVLFRQQRLGYNGRVFSVLKFRTMTETSSVEQTDAARLTPLGTILRVTSLDELPQLLNVMRGDMSLVGPRPLYTRYAPYYTPRESVRHRVRPGITGYAQVRGRNAVGWKRRLELDVQYVERASLRLDMSILVATVVTVVTRRGVAVVARASGTPLDQYRTYPRDEEIAMRPLAADDLPVRVRWMNDPGTRAHMRVPANVSLMSTLDWYNQTRVMDGREDFVAYDTRDGALVCMMGLRQRGRGEAESYIMVAPEKRGIGLGVRCHRLLLQWAFESAGYDRVVSEVARSNVASHRVHAKFATEVVPLDAERDAVIASRDHKLWA
jgi:lipopolysaccharide/colanic/teichoic acid biosynthesis glycosyltransferase/RimJ/RimL family protein N-acetyltransferase